MAHHLDAQGRFQSDKYPELAPDKIVVSLREIALALGEAPRG